MKRYSDSLIKNAMSLRSAGHTYREITRELDTHIPKSTLSSWFKHISLPPEYWARMKTLGHENIKLAQKQNKIRLESRLSQIRVKNINFIKKIDRPTGIIILSTLYWCEGNKYPSSRYLKFGNSDPKMISLFITLLRLCYKLDESKLRMTVQCRADQDQTVLSKYWEKITNIPPFQHYNPRVDSRSIGKPTLKSSYHGVCVIDYFDTDLQCELQFTGELLGSDASIELMKNQIK